MSPAELEALLIGMLRLWQNNAEVTVSRDTAGPAARITDGVRVISIRRQTVAFGTVWHVEPIGERQRTYSSINGLIRDLRQRLAPERAIARVLFVPDGRMGRSDEWSAEGE